MGNMLFIFPPFLYAGAIVIGMLWQQILGWHQQSLKRNQNQSHKLIHFLVVVTTVQVSMSSKRYSSNSSELRRILPSCSHQGWLSRGDHPLSQRVLRCAPQGSCGKVVRYLVNLHLLVEESVCLSGTGACQPGGKTSLQINYGAPISPSSSSFLEGLLL